MRILILLLCAWLAACSPVSAGSLPPTSLPTSAPRLLSSATLAPVRTPTDIAASPTPAKGVRLCSPFPGASRTDLIASISNPFYPPPPGSDDPHQGVDLAVQQNDIALAGGPVLAVLSGRVAMATEDRFPYGFMLLIETPLDEFPPAWLAEYLPIKPAPTLPPPPALTCPLTTPEYPWHETGRSLYILYAHLQEKAAFQVGDPIECGQPIGRVGQSGNALNPHLHLEVRSGPSEARFSSMAHYDNTAQPEEMANYCLWRVSNLFQLIDPQVLLGQLP